MREKIKNWYPPGYEEAWKEVLLFFVILGCGIFVSFDFLSRLDGQVEGLYYYNTAKGRILRPDGVAESFVGLAWKSLWGFGLCALFLVTAVIDHWLYYRRTTKSIYVMKRLPDRGVLARSCLWGPCMGAVLLVLLVLMIYSLYYLCYRLRIPEECMPRFL